MHMILFENVFLEIICMSEKNYRVRTTQMRYEVSYTLQGVISII